MPMTNQEILTKAIEQAIANGWDVELEDMLKEMQQRTSYRGQFSWPSGLLFSHDFAKAFFKYAVIPETPQDYSLSGYKMGLYLGGGSDGYGDYCDFLGELWQYHLQQMVISEDPIKYLGDNLKETDNA